MVRFNHKISQHISHFYVEQPYHLKHVGSNPFFGAQHDGVSCGWLQGYSVKPIQWLYRFRHNTNPTGITPAYLKNPLGKDLHWLEINCMEKLRTQLFTVEGFPHTMTAFLCIAVVFWQFSWYAYAHPELSLFNLAMGASKKFVVRERFNDKIEMDQPVFRWFQRVPEFYGYDGYRDLIKMGVIANDPYIEYVKKNGREKELLLYTTEKGWGEGGQGKLDHLMKKYRDERIQKEQDLMMKGPRGDHGFGSDAPHGAHH